MVVIDLKRNLNRAPQRPEAKKKSLSKRGVSLMISEETMGYATTEQEATTRKKLVEHQKAISVFELKPQQVLRRHFAFEDIPCHSGQYWFHRKYDPQEKDFYLELIQPGPNNTQSTINFIETECNYGGTRWWFECPSCQRRCAKLYEKRDDFYCRTCLNLEYLSHRTNYHSLIEVTLMRRRKMEEAEFKPGHTFYDGKMTRRARQEEKLRWQVEQGLNFATARFRQ